MTDELDRAIAARKQPGSPPLPEIGAAAASRRALREAQKQYHPPGTVPDA
eukprot:SAG22_NODE_19709_length_272_cov_0.849711_1_plen_49_part_01